MVVTDICWHVRQGPGAHGVSVSAATCRGCLWLGWRSGKSRWSSSPFSSLCWKLGKIFSNPWGAHITKVSCYAWDEFYSWNTYKIRLVNLICCMCIWCYHHTERYVLYSLEAKWLCSIFHCIATLLMSAHSSRSEVPGLWGLEGCFWSSILKALPWR